MESFSWRWAQSGGGIGYEVTLAKVNRYGSITIVSPERGQITVDGDAFGHLLTAMRTQKQQDGRVIRRWGDRAYVLVASDTTSPYISGLNPDFPWVNFSISELLPEEADSLTVSEALGDTGFRPSLGMVTVVNLWTIEAHIDPQPFVEALEVFAQVGTWVNVDSDMQELEVEVALMIQARPAYQDLERVDWTRSF